ncbi:DUF4132 domain-containing protein [Nocardiopsis coralliicola]
MPPASTPGAASSAAPGSPEFFAFTPALPPAVEHADAAAACAAVLSAADFAATARRLVLLPDEVRGRMAAHALVLYRESAPGPERRRILHLHASLLARQVDLHDGDGFETAALLAARDIGPDGPQKMRAVCQTALDSPGIARNADRLRTLDREFRRRLAENTLPRMLEAADDQEPRERMVWLATVLGPGQGIVAASASAQAARDLLAALPEDRVLDVIGERPSTDDISNRLAELPDGLRTELDARAAQLYAAAAPGEQREAALWARAALWSRPLQPLGEEAVVELLEAAAAIGDAAPAVEAVLGDRQAVEYLAELITGLPKKVQAEVADVCAETYSPTGSARRQKRAVHLHARLTMALNRADDRLAEQRQERLRFDPDSIGPRVGCLELAWVELKAGRDIPQPLADALRRDDRSANPFRARELRAVVKLGTGGWPPLNAGQPWADRALADLAAHPEWDGLLRHASTATASRPAARWTAAGQELLDGLSEHGAEEFRAAALEWLALVRVPTSDTYHDPYNTHAARGVVWLLSLLPEDAATVRAIAALLERSLRKSPGVGPGLPPLGNACAKALAALPGEAAFAEVVRLAGRTTYTPTRKLLDAALDARAAELGITREQAAELALPVYGLTSVGHAVEHFGGARAELSVEAGKTALRWFNDQGTPVKSVPAAVRREHAEKLAELKGRVKDITGAVTSIARSLDRSYPEPREWDAPDWRAHYLDHPVAGAVARRLIWTVGGTAALYRDGALRGLSGDPVEVRGTVQLWHPLDGSAEEARAWRRAVEESGTVQPFKQAHREVYLLTDAERSSGTYSNRFAGHFLRQRMFRSLAAERGWNDAQLRINHHHTFYPPAVRELPEHGLRAEYWVRGDDGEESESGAEPYWLLAADQVRFYPAGAPQNLIGDEPGSRFGPHGGHRVEPVPLESVPARVLSEILRDVDLFVGVAGVGADPLWEDGGPGGQLRAYWEAAAFGPLTETAETRRDVLERLLPLLAAGDRCRIDGRFVHVRGALHEYRIHLGSGNVLIGAGARHLCIVPDSAAAAPHGLPLPFQGDPALSLILSKALLLADDAAITDPVIVQQL